jgi:hypothetical protein
MPNNIKSEEVTTDSIGQYVDELITYAKTERRSFERRWYDNNFFDDGYHYRYLQRTTNKIVDLSDRSNMYNPMRAIPKASRQIRGIANLLVSSDPTPIVFPERVMKSRFIDPLTKQINEEVYKQALTISKDAAKKRGYWLEQEFEKQQLAEKMAFMVILAAKHGVSWLQIWPDAVEEQIKTQVYDAFDVFTVGSMTEPEDAPFWGKGVPRLISQVKADSRFDKDQVLKISPDNKRSSSEIKEAYLNSRYSKESNPDTATTILQKEVYIKEYLNSEVKQRIKLQDDADKILKDKEDDDMVMRQVFVAGNIWLRDRYVNLNHYPGVDFRFEPGNIYQVPMIERFIPTNKSIDAVTSRVEKFTHTMAVGAYMKRSGEQMKITNDAGGQVLEYDQTPPAQMALSPMPQYVFEFLSYLDKLVEEQGVSTSMLGKIPAGVKAASAIESLKATEYANLVIASRRLKRTVQTIAERMLEIADEYFVTPQEVQYLDKGNPDYFQVIGNSALQSRRKLKVETAEDVLSIKKDLKVEIEVQSGAAYTREGKRELAKQIMDTMLQYAQLGYLPPESIKTAFEQWLKDLGFGALSEFMDAWETASQNGTLTSANMQQIKVAVAEVMKDMVDKGVLPTPEQRIKEGQVATAQAIKDSGIVNQQSPQPSAKSPSESISFKDLPDSGKIQMAGQVGIQLNPNELAQEKQQEQQITNAKFNSNKV